MSELIKSQNLLGGSKIIVGDKSQNLVLANAGSIYIQYGGSYKKLQDVIKEQVDKGIEEYKQSIKSEQEVTASELKEDSEQTDSSEETTETQEAFDYSDSISDIQDQLDELRTTIAEQNELIDFLYQFFPDNMLDEEEEDNQGITPKQFISKYSVALQQGRTTIDKNNGDGNFEIVTQN